MYYTYYVCILYIYIYSVYIYIYIVMNKLFGNITTYNINTTGILTKGPSRMIYRLPKYVEHLLFRS